jgi:hypothetical protein
LIADIASHLGTFGIGVERVRLGRRPRRAYDAYAALIATTDLPPELRDRVVCYGSPQRDLRPRPVTLGWLQESGLPTMRWSLARDLGELMTLFDRWRTDRILLKRSGSFGGEGVTMFTRERATEIAWDARTDVFCPEVNPDDGDIYKLEMFGPTVLLGWTSRVPPARSMLADGVTSGLPGAYGTRAPFAWPGSIVRAAAAFGELALDHGHGHVSLDFMRTPTGGFEAIEANLGNVALWWTTQFRAFRRNFAHAVHRTLVERHGAPHRPAPAPVRLRHRVTLAMQQPRILVRTVQAARRRRWISRTLERTLAASSDPGISR